MRLAFFCFCLSTLSLLYAPEPGEPEACAAPAAKTFLINGKTVEQLIDEGQLTPFYSSDVTGDTVEMEADRTTARGDAGMVSTLDGWELKILEPQNDCPGIVMKTEENDTTVHFTYTHEFPENPFRWLDVPINFRDLAVSLDTNPNTTHFFTRPNGTKVNITRNSSRIGTSIQAGEEASWDSYVYCSSGGYYNIEAPLAVMKGNLFNVSAGMHMKILPKQGETPFFKALYVQGKPYPFERSEEQSYVFPMTAEGRLSAHAINATFAHLGDDEGFVKILFDPNIAPSRITRESATTPTPPAELETTFSTMALTANTPPVASETPPATPPSLDGPTSTGND
ncbi:MAG: hypothetical protein ACPGUZ_00030 [Holosporaceae bacterium]